LVFRDASERNVDRRRNRWDHYRRIGGCAGDDTLIP
jgi:hypothetical protein